MNATDYLEEKLAKHIFRIESFTMPAGLYMALSPTLYVDDNTALTEFTGGNYFRANCSSGKFGWDTTEKKIKNSAGAIEFPVLTETLANAKSYMLFDAASGGNMLQAGPLLEYVETSPGVWEWVQADIEMLAGTMPRFDINKFMTEVL